MKCLDTDLLVAILRGENNARAVLVHLDSEGRNETTAVTAFEVFHGANHSANRFANLQGVRALLQKLYVMPFVYRPLKGLVKFLPILPPKGY